jgi:tetratricopeptide (TPR) repeat protein
MAKMGSKDKRKKSKQSEMSAPAAYVGMPVLSPAPYRGNLVLKAVVLILVLGVIYYVIALQMAENELEQGLQHYQRGRYNLALKAFGQAVNILPLPNAVKPRAYLGQGYVYVKTGAYDKALSVFSRARRCFRLTNPVIPDARVGEGYAFFYQGKLAQAEQRFKKAAELRQIFGEPYVGLGFVNYQQGRYEQAKALFKKAVQRNPKLAEAYSGLGYIELHQGQYDPSRYPVSLAYFEEALLRDSFYVPASVGISYVQTRLLKLAQARETALKAVQKNPGIADTYMALGYASLKEQNIDKALAFFREAERRNPNLGDIDTGIGYALMKKKQPTEAILAFNRALKINPAYYQAYLGRAQAEYALGKRRQAVESLEKAFQINPRHAQADADWRETENTCLTKAISHLESEYYRLIKSKNADAISLLSQMEKYNCPVNLD